MDSTDPIRIRLEGGLERIERLTARWRAATAELRETRLPRAQTASDLRKAEGQAYEALRRLVALDASHRAYVAYVDARGEWERQATGLLRSRGVPVPKRGRALLDAVAGLGELEETETPVLGGLSPLKLLLGAGAVLGVLVLAVVAFELDGLFGIFDLPGLPPGEWWRSVRGLPVLSASALYLAGQPPLPLAQVAWVTLRERSREPTQFTFRLKDATERVLVCAPRAGLGDALERRGVRVHRR